MDLEAITALIGVGKNAAGMTKTATEVAQSLRALLAKPNPDTEASNRLVSELLERLLALQSEQLSMQSAMLELREEQRRIERFQANANRYTLKRTEQGSLVRELKASDADGDPIHCVCAECYEKQVISFLQLVGHNTFECGECDGIVYMSDGRDSGIMIAPVNRSSRFPGDGTV
ncbi:hypothetical protein [Chachezhania antarctica]|uniref:hypothetical protein n=1 Tax=Chachezhania antarctica TaxID=2340860 RepID=UPI000EB0CD2F|nr:hypothetical protein [Chachezhania antarctica]|tara:strand:+ start:2763 stop:3284 length:522 start_codon:yes stop_codon:yes gene_type:complete